MSLCFAASGIVDYLQHVWLAVTTEHQVTQGDPCLHNGQKY